MAKPIIGGSNGAEAAKNMQSQMTDKTVQSIQVSETYERDKQNAPTETTLNNYLGFSNQLIHDKGDGKNLSVTAFQSIFGADATVAKAVNQDGKDGINGAELTAYLLAVDGGIQENTQAPAFDKAQLTFGDAFGKVFSGQTPTNTGVDGIITPAEQQAVSDLLKDQSMNMTVKMYMQYALNGYDLNNKNDAYLKSQGSEVPLVIPKGEELDRQASLGNLLDDDVVAKMDNAQLDQWSKALGYVGIRQKGKEHSNESNGVEAFLERNLKSDNNQLKLAATLLLEEIQSPSAWAIHKNSDGTVTSRYSTINGFDKEAKAIEAFLNKLNNK